jgi:hypothetical protein
MMCPSNGEGVLPAEPGAKETRFWRKKDGFDTWQTEMLMTYGTQRGGQREVDLPTGHWVEDTYTNGANGQEST